MLSDDTRDFYVTALRSLASEIEAGNVEILAFVEDAALLQKPPAEGDTAKVYDVGLLHTDIQYRRCA
jgi:hypothetical protein